MKSCDVLYFSVFQCFRLKYTLAENAIDSMAKYKVIFSHCTDTSKFEEDQLSSDTVTRERKETEK